LIPRVAESKPNGKRRNLRTAAVLGLIALAFYVAFFFAVSHRGF
jgi:hypothetical protein